ncbi:hypothetical protein POM88_049473 [Heracleum sosnowskyi]|uniref:Uncharacterized protein n=1 Tax=Heracleum sosnowskyi TaxID=360622 RepID=A0AAD8GXS9_9APIA|nr:hypothetical protein POM88_049473 [Heracleum sosnowskyi]
MVHKQSISQTNFAGIYSPNDVGEDFKGLVSFLNKSYLGYAIISTPVLDLDRIDNFWESAVAEGDGDNAAIKFKIKENSYTLTIQGINAALGIVLEPGKTYKELVDDETLKKLFLKIGYSGPILEEGTTKWYTSGEMDRKYLRKEWSMILDAMVKVFSTKTTGWNGIPTYIKKLTHSLVHGYKVDVGKLLMAHLKAAIEACNVLKRNTHITLTSQNLNAHIQLCFTQHMVDQVPNLDFPLPTGYETFSLKDEAELDPNSANPHSTPYTLPRFSRLPKVQRQALQESNKRPLETGVGGSTESQEGVTEPSAANKEGSQTEPTVVPPESKKKRAKRGKTTVSHPAVSQKTIEENRATNTSLDVPSQQGTSIETGMSPKASCKESAQPHVSPHEELTLAETHKELGHSEDFTSTIDASQVHPVEHPIFSSPLSPSSFPTTSFVSSPQPREGDSPNPSGFDHSSPIMDEPPSSGPQEPISQSEMETTLSNTELEQGATLPESETASALFNLQVASYLREGVVTASAAVKDIINVAVTDKPVVKDAVKVAVTTKPDVQDAVKPTVTPSVDSNISGKPVVTSTQLAYDEVLIEDASDDDVSLSQYIKVHSKPSFSMHSVSIVATGFAGIQHSIHLLSAKLDAANLPKGEKRVRSESVQEQGGAKGVSVSQGESGRKGEQFVEQQASGASNLCEVEIDGENVLMSKEALEEMQGKKKTKRPILPPVSIREPTPQPQETAYQKLWREKEEQNKMGKGKGKMPEYCIS